VDATALKRRGAALSAATGQRPARSDMLHVPAPCTACLDRAIGACDEHLRALEAQHPELAPGAP